MPAQAKGLQGIFGASSHTWLQDQIDHPAEKQQWEASITKSFLLSDSSGSSWSVCLLVYAFWAPFFGSTSCGGHDLLL